jgi:hypothetical protein
MKLDRLVTAYEQLIQLMKARSDARLVPLVVSISKSLDQLNQMRTEKIDSKTTRAMLIGLKQGLREMPMLLASVVPESHLQLVREFEKALGQKFSDF